MWTSAEAGFRAARDSADRLGARPWSVEAEAGPGAALAPPAEAAALRASAARGGGGRSACGTRAVRRGIACPRRGNEFRHTGETWSLDDGRPDVHVPDAKGLRDLHVLLSPPGTEIPAATCSNPAAGERWWPRAGWAATPSSTTRPRPATGAA